MSGEFAAGVRRAALDLLARREHSAVELRRKLQRRFGDCAEVDGVLGLLIANGLQSDARFAENFVRIRSASGHGPLRIRQELQHRGVAESIRERVLDHGDSHWLELAREVRVKRFGQQLPADAREWARQARFLEYRGFSREQVRQAVGRLRHAQREPA